MPRDVDERKKRKALRKLRKAAMLAEQGLGPPLSEWEQQFLEEVEQRIETYGSAFHDPEKGGADEPLSALQKVKLREIDKKARGKGKSGFKSKSQSFKNRPRANVRQLDEVEEEDAIVPPETKAGPKLVKASEMVSPERKPPDSPKPAKKRPALRVIKGGAADD